MYGVINMKSNEYWGLYNASNLWGVAKTQRELKETAIEATGEPWSKCKKYFRIVRVRVEPI
jgi:hypothetical protein